MKTSCICLFCLVLISHSSAQRQYADSSYRPPLFAPAYPTAEGPVFHIDKAHNNFHTREGRYYPFAQLLEMDGFRTADYDQVFSPESLAELELLVIANALPESSLERWVAPTASAFTEAEISSVEAWVRGGGRLFLLADHMPMGGAAADLAAAFGYTFHDGFAEDTTTTSGAVTFTRADGGLLTEDPLIHGGHYRFPVDSVTSFTGQAFQYPAAARSLLRCGPSWVVHLTEVAWQFTEETPRLSAAGWSQLAIQDYGAGKIVFAGEAAMFSAQIAEIEGRSFQAGMNSERGKNNYRLLLNLIRWLDEGRKFPVRGEVLRNN